VKRSLSSPADLSARCLRALILVPIKAYRRFVSPAIPNRCKYYPSCSAYAVEAIREVGALRGSILAAWRLVRCNPFSHGGYDPVEDRPIFKSRDVLGSRSLATRITGNDARSLPPPPPRGVCRDHLR
jgi:putative membrane protein insertion efficiency factor